MANTIYSLKEHLKELIKNNQLETIKFNKMKKNDLIKFYMINNIRLPFGNEIKRKKISFLKEISLSDKDSIVVNGCEFIFIGSYNCETKEELIQKYISLAG